MKKEIIKKVLSELERVPELYATGGMVSTDGINLDTYENDAGKMKKKDLLKRIEELEKKVSELESEKPVEKERKHLELSVSLDDSKEKSKSIDYAINGGWAYSTFTTTNRDGNFQEKNVMLYLSTSNGTWKNESGSKISGFLSYHPKGE